jgi:predicted  nucleic acid-binding Zn-ribbon protein
MRLVNLQKYVSRYELNIRKGKLQLSKVNSKKEAAALNRKLDRWEVKLSNFKNELKDVQKIVSGT